MLTILIGRATKGHVWRVDASFASHSACLLAKSMPTTAYVAVADPQDRAWITSALAGAFVDVVRFAIVDVVELAKLPRGPGQCLIVTADEDEAATFQLVRELRHLGNDLPIIVVGPYSAFRTAVEIARLESTDFLERPVSVRQLRSAVRRAC